MKRREDGVFEMTEAELWQVFCHGAWCWEDRLFDPYDSLFQQHFAEVVNDVHCGINKFNPPAQSLLASVVQSWSK